MLTLTSVVDVAEVTKGPLLEVCWPLPSQIGPT
jgi:hypothetical protein